MTPLGGVSAWADRLALKSVRSRMVALVALAMLPTGALAIRAGLDAGQARAHAFAEAQTERAISGLQRGATLSRQTADVLQVLSVDGARLLADPATCGRRLAEVARSYAEFGPLVGVGPNFAIRCSAPPMELGKPAPDNTILQRAQARNGFASALLRNTVAGDGQAVAAAALVRDSHDRLQGYFALTLPAQSAFREMRQTAKGALSNVAIIDDDGEFAIADPASASAATLRAAAGPANRPRSADEIRRFDADGRHLVAVSLHWPDLWAVGAVAPLSPSLQSRFGDFTAVFNPLSLWLLAVAAAWFSMELAVVRPLKSLEAAAQARSEGRPSAENPAEPPPPTEIRLVRSAIEDMAGRLLARTEQLEAALQEEKALLREVHHRVKNNLQTVASLLQIQSRAAENDSEAWGLSRAYDRVQLLAIVHQRIYSSGVVRNIRLDDLAADIARHLVGARGAATARVKLSFFMEPTRCDADKVAAMAFLIGEGLTRALDAIGDGAVELRLHLRPDEGRVTRIAIDAIGPVPTETKPSVELRFIEAFARQLRARVGVAPDNPAFMWCEAVAICSETPEDEVDA